MLGRIAEIDKRFGSSREIQYKNDQYVHLHGHGHPCFNQFVVQGAAAAAAQHCLAALAEASSMPLIVNIPYIS
jgi:hypothetical protein